MNLQQLDLFLHENTESEIWHLKHPGELSPRYQNIPRIQHKGREIFFFDFSDDIRNEEMAVIRESRYTTLMPHCHKYLEINYVYSGQCHFHINDSDVMMHQGDLCILEEGTVHEADYKGENDIVINLVLKDNFYGEDFLRFLNREKVISSFLMNCYNQSVEHNHFLLFRGGKSELFDLTMKGILCLYFSERTVGFYSMLHEYIRMMFLHLSMMEIDVSHSSYAGEDDRILSEIIREIHDNYNTCSLRNIAEKYSYNYTYTGNMLKSKTGHTFSELKLEQQLLSAREMLRYTNLPVDEICFRCGSSNQAYF